jgi:transcriptional regulator with XRE-family HTH domain
MTDLTSDATEKPVDLAAPSGGFGHWLRRTRESFAISQMELGRRSGVSNVTISFIETGRTQNPTRTIRDSLVEALNAIHQERGANARPQTSAALEAPKPSDIAEEEAELAIPGLGSLEAFDPFAIDQIPDQPGVYVFYDISDRPIYVGRSKNVRNRVRTHHDRFWFKQPLVTTAYYLRVDDNQLRSQIEKVLIQFLRSNAVVNKIYVDRDSED